MSSIGHAASSMLTPMSKIHASHSPGLSSTKQAQELNSLRLSLNSVVGTTTHSVNAFDALPEQHTFVYCAGPAAVLARVDEHLNITQQLFRATPNAVPFNAIPSFYNSATPPSTPGKSRHGSPSKERGCGLMYGGANNRSRETSCVSLSRGGNLMAVGEVNWPAPGFAIFD